MPNLYQPEFLQTAPWTSVDFIPSEATLQAAGMLSYDERIMLSWLAEHVYQGHGEIAELGVFVGSLTISLAAGLQRNKNVQSKAKRIHAYDLFAGSYEAKHLREQHGKDVAEADNSVLSIRKTSPPTKRLSSLRQATSPPLHGTGIPLKFSLWTC